MITTSVPVLIMGLVTLYVSIFYFIIVFSFEKPFKQLLFPLMALSISLYDIISALAYNSRNIEDAVWFQRGQFSMAAAFTILTYLFIKKELRGRFSPVDLIYSTLVLPFTILPWIPSKLLLTVEAPVVRTISFIGITMTTYEGSPGLILYIEYGLMMAGLLYLYGSLIFRFIRNRTLFSAIYIAAFTIFFAAAVNDILIGAGVIQSVYLIEYAFFSMILLMNYNLIKRFVRVSRRSGRLNAELEEKVRERSEEINRLNEEMERTNRELERKNSQLKNLAEKDGLTGLLNHASFLKRLSEMLNMSRRYQFPITLVMIDVDDFKPINDNYGHPVGDNLLKTVASLFRLNLNSIQSEARKEDKHYHTQLRNYDLAARYGGDEFALILPFCSADGASAALDRIYKQLKLIGVEGYDGAISLSSGAVSTEKLPEATGEELIQFADEALYLAKSRGKNCYVLF